MCSIVGWYGKPPETYIRQVLKHGPDRGRDGWGYQLSYGRSGKGPSTCRSLDPFDDDYIDVVLQAISPFPASVMLANFRAAPTTEAESKVENLQPYFGIVHTGTIANDAEFGKFEIDSMALPTVLLYPYAPTEVIEFRNRLKLLVGSYAIAFMRPEGLFLATNYQPIYFDTDWQTYFIFSSVKEGLPPFSSRINPYTANIVYYQSALWDKVNPASMHLYGDLASRSTIVNGEETNSSFVMNSIPLPRTQNKQVLVAASSGADSTNRRYLCVQLLVGMESRLKEECCRSLDPLIILM